MPDTQDYSQHTSIESASTYEYDHEPFKTFEDKIAALSADLWPCTISDIRRLKGGSFNRVIAARANWLEDGSSTPLDSEVVFRIPRFLGNDELNDKVQDQAAIVQFIRRQQILAPEVLAFDATSANAISSPYTVQRFIHGTALDLVYEHMSLQQKLDFADDLVELLAKLEMVEFPLPGRLERDHVMENLTRWRSFDKDSSVDSWSTELRCVRRLSLHGFDYDKSNRSPLSFIRGEIDAWQAELAERVSLGAGDGFKREYFRRLQHLCDQMQADRHFDHGQSKNRNVLHHWDLEPRNIIVQHEGEGTEIRWRIAGVLDWDDALSLPATLCRQPPVWLWDPSYNRSSWPQHHDYDGDIDALAPTYYSGIEGDDQQIKRRFEEKYIKKVMALGHHGRMEAYVDEAYGTGRWLRRLWRFARYGFSSEQDVKRLNKLEQEWLEHCST